jgi:putative acetyltransferase
MTREGRSPGFEVRPEDSAHASQVRRVNEQAFGRPGEAALVDTLRGGHDSLSLVAVSAATVVGHILFTPVRIETIDGTFPATGLGPMAVAPEWQRRGVGTALVRAGVETCRLRGDEAIVVLGHPDFYPRFGFVRASTRGLRFEHPVPDAAFMVLELRAEARGDRRGVVRYHPAFATS